MTDDIEKGRIGSSFDDFLREEGALDETNERAMKRVLARQNEATTKTRAADDVSDGETE